LSKREKLRRILALASVDLLTNHSKSFVNIKRYVVPNLTKYGIRKHTKIRASDIRVSLDMVHNASKQNPTIFYTAPIDSPWAVKRKDFFLNSPLQDLVTMKDLSILDHELNLVKQPSIAEL